MINQILCRCERKHDINAIGMHARVKDGRKRNFDQLAVGRSKGNHDPALQPITYLLLNLGEDLRVLEQEVLLKKDTWQRQRRERETETQNTYLVSDFDRVTAPSW